MVHHREKTEARLTDMLRSFGTAFRNRLQIDPKERNKGHCTEAVNIIVDYLFLAKNTVRIQAKTNPKNVASQRVLEKAGFQKEGLIRKDIFIRGAWQDGVLYSILKEEWKEPRILTKATTQKQSKPPS